MTRASLPQEAPDPGVDWATFPASRAGTGTVLWRAARRGREPWWFCSCGDCRFDLDPPRGTCYAGTDELLRHPGEHRIPVGQRRAADPGVLAQPHLASCVAADLLDGPLANLTSRKAVGFRITNEPPNMTPYDIPRAFARLIDAARKGSRRVFGGLRFRTRFGTGFITARGIALFGDAGPCTGVSTAEQEIFDELVDALVELGLNIDGPPPLSALLAVVRRRRRWRLRASAGACRSLRSPATSRRAFIRPAAGRDARIT